MQGAIVHRVVVPASHPVANFTGHVELRGIPNTTEAMSQTTNVTVPAHANAYGESSDIDNQNYEHSEGDADDKSIRAQQDHDELADQSLANDGPAARSSR
jgi:hypothetical protein